MAFAYDEDAARRAQPTWYGGTKYRSKFEAKTAQALDNIGIPYAYEPSGYQLSNGMWYRPDFYLTAAQQYIECKGEASNEDMAKVVGLVQDTNRPVLVISYESAMLVMRYWNDVDNPIQTYDGEMVSLGVCLECGGLWFYAHPDTYKCRCCGTHDGDHHLGDELNPLLNGTTLFRYGQSVAASDPLYSELADRFNSNE